MKIVCTTSIPYAEEAFGTLGAVAVLPGRTLKAAQVRDADILVVRSTTPVNRALLDDSRVRFVGTATIGFDHMDVDYLNGAGIAWCAAPGCNANSVAEYMVAAWHCLARRHGFTLEGKTIGVVGVGNVGSRVVRSAQLLGMKVLQNDPPRHDATKDPVFRSLDKVLADADIVTLHTPLTREGKYPTFQMADHSFFKRLKPGCLFINAARGALVCSDDLLQAMREGQVAHAVLDTWEGEPAFRADVLERVDLGTPHIAGYSFDGKVMGTVMVYRDVCRFLGVKPDWSPEGLLPAPPVPEVRVEVKDRDDETAIGEIVRRVYDIEADDARMRAGMAADESARAAHFDALRKNYPMRREFPFTVVTLDHGRPTLERKLRGLGFALG